MIELLSIDLSNYCSKQCTFCYNHSTKVGNTMWQPSEVIAFASDCVAHGVKAVSLGGGEPFEYDGVFDVTPFILCVTCRSLQTDCPWKTMKCGRGLSNTNPTKSTSPFTIQIMGMKLQGWLVWLKESAGLE